MKGFGTVVTGTLISGSIRKDEELEVFPLKKRVRVRGVQVHGSAAEVATAGQRTALNLAGATVEELSRGMMLAPPGTFQATRRADVSLSLLQSAKPLKERVRVHFHSHTMETVAELSLYGAKQLAPGQNAFAQVRLASPALLLPGDRFIVRQFSPVVTIGGGIMLDAAPIVRKRKLNAGPLLETFNVKSAPTILHARVERRGRDGATMASLTSETGWPKK
jgi:selenocysteine-specific elongation factor